MNQQLMALHWGQILQSISVDGLDPASGVLTPTPETGVIVPETSRGSIKQLIGRGGVKPVSGSGGNG